jgi:O-antigen/teichoic acid export membrane protein
MANSTSPLTQEAASDNAPPGLLRATLKRLAKMTAGYSLVTLIGPVFTILLTPLYTRVLSPADYGVLEVAGAFAGFAGIFTVIGIDLALNALFFDGDETYQRNLVTTALVCVTACGSLVAAFYVVAGARLAVWFFKDAGRVYMFYLYAIGSVSSPIVAVISAALRLRMGVKRVNVLAATSLLANVGTTIVMVLVIRLKATGIVAANMTASVVTCVTGLALAYQSLRGSFSPQLAKPLVRTGLTLVPAVASGLALAIADRLLLVWYVSQTDLGLYSIANKLASMLLVMLGATWAAWQPMALEMANQPDAARQYARVFEYIAAASMLLSLAVGLFAPEILLIFTRAAYVPAAPFTLVLTAYYGPVIFLESSLAIPLYARKRTHIVSVITFISAGVNIALNLLLDPWLGVWGAVLATVLAGGVAMAGTYIAGQRAMWVPYRLPQVCGLGGFYVVLIAAAVLLPALGPLAVRLAVWASFALAIAASGIVSRGQIQLAFQSAYTRLSSLVHTGHR